jgi:hypothetical protein
MAPSINRFASQAAQDALLKFAPVKGSLAEALQQAKEAYGSTVSAGNSTARLTEQAAKAQEPAIRQIYKGANAAQNAGVTLVNQQLANLPGVTNQYKAEQAAEAQTQLANLLGSKTRDEAMLHQSGVAAREGAQFNQTNARQALQRTLTSLLAKSNTTAQEQGAFAATETEKLAHEAEVLEQRERASERTANTSTENSKRSTSTSRQNAIEGHRVSEANSLRAHPGAAGGVKLLSTAEMNKGATTLDAIRNYAKGLAAKGLTRGQLVAELSNGSPAQSVGVNAAGKPVKEGEKASQHIKVAAVPAYKPDVLMSAALDEVLMGGISKGTVNRLHNAGYSVKALGLRVGAKPKSQQEAENLHRAGF